MCVRGGQILPNASGNGDGYPIAGRIYTVESGSFARFSVGVHPALTLPTGSPNRKGDSGVLKRRAVWPAQPFARFTR